jgi:mannose-6-phosphate isomerase-like protein (cupin superfamily)
MTVHAAFDPRSAYVDFTGTDSPVIPLDDDFWPSLLEGRRQIAGSLVSAFTMARDIDHWEAHPAGDEILFMHSGATDLLLELPGGVQRVTLKAGMMFVVPRGIWHTFKARETGTLLAITPGEGTEHRKRPEA